MSLVKLNEAAGFLRTKFGEAPLLAVVLGSGLDQFVEAVEGAAGIPYQQIPHFPVPTVAGHPGKVAVGTYKGISFCVLQGRVHFYEGHSLQDVVFAVRTLGIWGVDTFVITNMAGALNPEFKPGDLMLIKDHINLMGSNPLLGFQHHQLGDPFLDLSEAYDCSLRTLGRECARETGIEIREGIYVAVTGPNYETPAEVRMCQMLGADAVGMSTVPEVLALIQMCKRVLGISCIANMAAGLTLQRSRHEDVLQIASRARNKLSALVLKIIERFHGR